MAPTQTIDYPCPTCSSMALVRVSPIDRQYDVRFLKCEVCKCELCSHMDKSLGETVRNQGETEMISAAIESPRRDNGSEHAYNWARATPIAAPSLTVPQGPSVQISAARNLRAEVSVDLCKRPLQVGTTVPAED